MSQKHWSHLIQHQAACAWSLRAGDIKPSPLIASIRHKTCINGDLDSCMREREIQSCAHGSDLGIAANLRCGAWAIGIDFGGCHKPRAG